MDVNAIDLCGIESADEARDLEAAAAENLKRVRRPAEEDWSESPGLSRLTQYLELKTVWHPIGV